MCAIYRTVVESMLLPIRLVCSKPTRADIQSSMPPSERVSVPKVVALGKISSRALSKRVVGYWHHRCCGVFELVNIAPRGVLHTG